MSAFRSLVQLVAIACCFTAFVPNASAQCNLVTESDPLAIRSGPNQVTGTASTFPVAPIVGNWTVTITAVLRFTPNFGSEQSQCYQRLPVFLAPS